MRVISVSVSVKGLNSKKKSTCSAGDQIQSLGREDPLENGMTIHSSILAWRIPWTEEPGGLQSMGLQRFGHYWATFTVFHFLSERLLQLLENQYIESPHFAVQICPCPSRFRMWTSMIGWSFMSHCLSCTKETTLQRKLLLSMTVVLVFRCYPVQILKAVNSVRRASLIEALTWL